ncbi:hypothetical protein Vadar_016347 [Vaccinium darrowii]|uniref:Uncharacterized protein n=1 Tax=Vaccinium darrowii TaxID=229202 RepID=A0ACB7ZK96_9ERIC|nr:hypothetical protein Vadar_016347 [Vaccinium darrowii]
MHERGKPVSIVVAFHLVQNGIEPSYKTWVHHGETIPVNQPYRLNESGIMNDDELDESPDNAETENVRKFEKLMKDAHRELYPGCKFTLLSFVIKLLHVKVLNKWSNKSFDALLELLKELLPISDEDIPGNIYEAKKILT